MTHIKVKGALPKRNRRTDGAPLAVVLMSRKLIWNSCPQSNTNNRVAWPNKRTQWRCQRQLRLQQKQFDRYELLKVAYWNLSRIPFHLFPPPPHAHVIPGVSSITGHHPRQLQSHSSPHLLIICTAWQQSACYLLKHALGGPATDIHNSNWISRSGWSVRAQGLYYWIVLMQGRFC